MAFMIAIESGKKNICGKEKKAQQFGLTQVVGKKCLYVPTLKLI